MTTIVFNSCQWIYKDIFTFIDLHSPPIKANSFVYMRHMTLENEK